MTRAQKNLAGLAHDFTGINIHKEYLYGIAEGAFRSGLETLADTFTAIYTGMNSTPQAYAMKNEDDSKGLVKYMHFLLVAAQKGSLCNTALEIDGSALAQALKDAKVTKPEMYFPMLAAWGFTTTGLGKKIESSETIILEYPDNRYLVTALKAMADAVSAFSKINANGGNHYFEMLDARVLENNPATEPKATMEYILAKVNNESRDVVGMFYEYIKPHAKCTIKGSLHWYLTPTFTLKSTKKVIMSFKITLDSHEIKLNLAHLGEYAALLDGFPERLKKEIINNGWNCGQCATKPSTCAFAFDLDGISYRKCRCGSFVFAEPDKNDARLLLGLLEKELSFA